MCSSPIFEGVATALITPFDESGIDFGALEKIIERQIGSGVSALVAAGTTGEGSTLTRGEYRELIRFSAKIINKRVPLIAGAGSNDTKKAAEAAKDACDCGADALLLVTPYYNKCTQRGLLRHYAEIAGAAKLPFIAYNVPARTGMEIAPETAGKIAAMKYAAGIKDAGGNLAKTLKTVACCQAKMPLYSGSDDLIVPTLSVGGKGVISVLSNVAPEKAVLLCELFNKGKTREAAEMQAALLPLTEALFCEVNPIPVKAAMSYIGACKNIVRAPLTPLSANGEKKLKAAMKALL